MLQEELRQRLAVAQHHAKFARMHAVASQIAIAEILKQLDSPKPGLLQTVIKQVKQKIVTIVNTVVKKRENQS